MNSSPRHFAGRTGQHEKASVTHENINDARVGVEAHVAFTEGPAAFADSVRSILSVAAPLHVLQATSTGKLPESDRDETLTERNVRLASGTSRGQWFED
jgi:hypothetical protein